MIRLGLRLTLNGGREAAVRLLLTTAAVALGVGLLLVAISGMNAINAQNARAAWLTATFGPARGPNLPGASNLPSKSGGNASKANGSYTGPPPSVPGTPNYNPGNTSSASGSSSNPLWWKFSTIQFQNQTIDRIELAPTGTKSPVPPGITHLPGPGEFYASPALENLMSTTPASELANRFPGTLIGTIGASALPSPNSMIIVAGYSAKQLSKAPGVIQVLAINTDTRFGGPNGFDAYQLQVILAVGLLALLLPVLVFIWTATRLGAARREQRFAAMRLVGASPRQVAMVSAVESIIAALGGVALGFIVFFLFRPALANVPFTGAPFAPGDLALSLRDVVLVAVGVPIAASTAALLALRNVTHSPLGVTRRVTPRKPRVYRLIPLLAGVGELAYFVAAGRPNGTGGQIGAYFLGCLLLMVGLVVAGPWLTLVGSKLMVRRTSRPSVLLAARRLGDNPRGAFRSISGLILALFITSVSIGAVTTILDYHSESSGTVSSDTLLDQFMSGRSGAKQVGTLPPSPSNHLMEKLNAIGGVQGVAVIHSDPKASDNGLTVTGFVSCTELRQTPALGRCAPGAVVAKVAGNLGVSELTTTSRLEETVWPTATISLAQSNALPIQAIIVRTNGSISAIERARTVLILAYPLQGSPSALGEISAQDTRMIAELKQMTSVVIAASLIVAACSLMMSVVAGIVERRRPFSLLRLAGVPNRILRRVVELEAVLPLFAAAALAITTGFVAAELFLRSQLGENLRPPGMEYYMIVALGLAVSLVIIESTLPLIERITGAEVARNE